MRDGLIDAADDRGARNDRIDLPGDMAMLLTVGDIASGRRDRLRAAPGIDRDHLRAAVQLAHDQMGGGIRIEKIDAGLEPGSLPDRPGQRLVDRVIDDGPVAIVEIRDQDGDQPRLRSEVVIGEADRDACPAGNVRDLEIAFAVDQLLQGRRHDALPGAAFAIALAANSILAGVPCHLDS